MVSRDETYIKMSNTCNVTCPFLIYSDHKTPMRRTAIVSLFFLLISSISHLAVAKEAEETNHIPQWSVLAGYGSSHPGWGETEVRVETIDLIVRRSSIILDDIGSSWYRGYHSLLIELPVHFLLDYHDSPMIGLNFLARYTFVSNTLQPYIFVGGGPVYVDADIPGMGSNLNGNYQIGIGLNSPYTSKNSFFFETRYHHISNGNTSDPNDPLNSLKFLFGFSF